MLRRSKQPTTTAVPAVVASPTLSPDIEQAARVEAQLANARWDLASATVEAEAARASYEDAADAGHLSKAVAAKASLSEAETRADIAGRRVARLDAELQQLLDGAANAAAAAEREQLRETAQEAWPTTRPSSAPSCPRSPPRRATLSGCMPRPNWPARQLPRLGYSCLGLTASATSPARRARRSAGWSTTSG